MTPKSIYSSGSGKLKQSKSPLLQEVRNLTRRLHMSIRTEEAYVQWIDKFLRYHRDKLGRWRHPVEMESQDVNDFLTYLAVERRVAASTQNQALSALLFLFRKLLQQEIKLDAAQLRRSKDYLSR